MLRGLAIHQAPVAVTSRQYPWLIVAISLLIGLMLVPWISSFASTVSTALVLRAFASLMSAIVVQMSVNYFLRYGNNPLRRWLDYRPFWLNILLRIGILLVTAAVFSIGQTYISRYLGLSDKKDTMFSAVAGSQIFAFIIIVIQLAIEAMERSQYLARENDQLKQSQLQARFEGLKQQLSPHFLFNSLSTLNSLIHEAPMSASLFVEEMAEVYRYLLHHGEQTAVTLRDEVAFLRSYFYLLRMRFGESLYLNLDLPEAIQDRMLPPLALQLLVENVVKHNAFTQRQPLHIVIEFRAPATLLVRNTRQPRRRHEPSSGVGLSNLTSRLRMLHQQELLVEQSEDTFCVYVPLPA